MPVHARTEDINGWRGPQSPHDAEESAIYHTSYIWQGLANVKARDPFWKFVTSLIKVFRDFWAKENVEEAGEVHWVDSMPQCWNHESCTSCKDCWMLTRFNKSVLHIVFKPEVDLVIPAWQKFYGTDWSLRFENVAADHCIPLVLLCFFILSVVSHSRGYQWSLLQTESWVIETAEPKVVDYEPKVLVE